MTAPVLINIAGLALCGVGVAQSTVDAMFARGMRARMGSMFIAAVALAGLLSFLARTAALALA